MIISATSQVIPPAEPAGEEKPSLVNLAGAWLPGSAAYERGASVETGALGQVAIRADHHGRATRAGGGAKRGGGVMAQLVEAVDRGQVAQILPPGLSECGGGDRAAVVEAGGVGGGSAG